KAAAAFDEALSRAPGDPGLQSNKGTALVSLAELQAGLSRHEEAQRSYFLGIAAFDEALSHAPDNAGIHANKGTALQSLGDLQAELSERKEAQRSYNQA